MALKHTRSRQFLQRLTRWREPWKADNWPWIIRTDEVAVEDLRKLFPLIPQQRMKTVGYQMIGGVSVEIMEPIEMRVKL